MTCAQRQQGTRSHPVFLTLCMCVCILVAQSDLILWPHGLWPARLFCPWNSPGKNTGVGSHSLLQGIFLTQGSNLGICVAGRFFTVWATREALTLCICICNYLCVNKYLFRAIHLNFPCIFPLLFYITQMLCYLMMGNKPTQSLMA